MDDTNAAEQRIRLDQTSVEDDGFVLLNRQHMLDQSTLIVFRDGYVPEKQTAKVAPEDKSAVQMLPLDGLESDIAPLVASSAASSASAASAALASSAEGSKQTDVEFTDLEEDDFVDVRPSIPPELEKLISEETKALNQLKLENSERRKEMRELKQPPKPTLYDSVLHEDKGLTNNAGEYNCFLNVALQLLWHNRSFRQCLLEESNHKCATTESECVFCQLRSLFANMKHSEEITKVAPTNVRQVMSKLYASMGKFQMFQMDDAAEVLDAILTRVHLDMTSSEADPSRCIPQCPVHRIFSCRVQEDNECLDCGKVLGRQLNYSSFVQYYSVDLLQSVMTKIGFNPKSAEYSFTKLLRTCSEDLRTCVGCDHDTMMSRRTLLNHPYVLSLGFIWDSDQPGVQQVRNLFAMIQPWLDGGSLFTEAPNIQEQYRHFTLRGLVCYYGRHYVAFYFSKSKEQWLLFDDTSFRAVGATFEELQNLCIRSAYQPSVLFYEIV